MTIPEDNDNLAVDELFKVPQPFEDNEKDPEPASEEVEPEEDKGGEGEKDEIDYKKRFDDSQIFIEELRSKNTEQEDSIQDLTGRLKHLEEVAKKNYEVINPEEEYKEYEAPEKPEKPDASSVWADKVEKEEKALVSVFPDYYDVVGSGGQKDSPFLKAIAEDSKLYEKVANAERPAAEAYKIGLDYKLAQASKGKDPVPPKPKTPSLRDAPGSNVPPDHSPEDTLGNIFKK